MRSGQRIFRAAALYVGVDEIFAQIASLALPTGKWEVTMNSRNRLEQGVRFVVWLACAGCAQDEEGAAPWCFEGAPCVDPPMVHAVEHVAEVQLASSLPEIPEYRVEPLPITQLPEANLRLGGGLRLTGDNAGHAWLFAADLEADGVRVTRLDDEDGHALDSSVLAPPKGAVLPSRTPVQPNTGAALLPSMRPSSTSSVWPAARIVWQTPCKPTDNCPLVEKILFADNQLEAPLRQVITQATDDVTANDRKERVTITHGGAGGPVVSWLDDAGNMLWAHAMPWAHETSVVKAVPLADGQFALQLDDSASRTPWRAWYYSVDQHGTLTTAWDFALLDLYANEPTYLASDANVPVRIETDSDGQLTIRWMQEQPARADGVKFRAADDTSLVALGFSITPEGVVYVLTRTGARDARRTTLCRAASDSKGSCALVPTLRDANTGEAQELTDIVAQDSGTVLGRAGTSFVRLQFEQ